MEQDDGSPQLQQQQSNLMLQTPSPTTQSSSSSSSPSSAAVSSGAVVASPQHDVSNAAVVEQMTQQQRQQHQATTPRQDNLKNQKKPLSSTTKRQPVTTTAATPPQSSSFTANAHDNPAAPKTTGAVTAAVVRGSNTTTNGNSSTSINSSSGGGGETRKQQQQMKFEMHPISLPKPRGASKCALFCCFYAEFDNKVGPQIVYQSPCHFMDQDINVSIDQVHEMLQNTFAAAAAAAAASSSSKTANDNKNRSNNNGNNAMETTTTTESSPSSTTTTTHPHASCTSALMNTNEETSKSDHDEENDNETLQDPQPTGEGGNTRLSQTTTMESSSTGPSSNNPTSPPSTGPTAGPSNNPTSPPSTGTTSSSSNSLSIFDSLSEYIITGAELTGNIIHLATHHIHVLTRPTIISNERYERNSLLFSVGFILRRETDPRPFRPILSKFALTLRDMEIESHFLSNNKTRPQLQNHLERMLISLNTSPFSGGGTGTVAGTTRQQMHNNGGGGNNIRSTSTGGGGSGNGGGGVECNLILSQAHVLNLKLFHPPKVPACPVPDRAVPVLLKRDWQVQTYDWDLSINWVSLHIDGVTNARQISKKAEVDIDMVRACLRVLRHHGVIALVDMFFFSNRYECTDRAAVLMLAAAAATAATSSSSSSNHPEEKSSVPQQQQQAVVLLNDAVDFCVRSRQHQQQQQQQQQVPVSSRHSPIYHPGGGGNTNNNSREASPLLMAQQSPASSYLLEQHQQQQQQKQHHGFSDSTANTMNRRDDSYYEELKVAVAELYCSCHRNQSIGEMWINLCERGGGSGHLRQQQHQQRAGQTKAWRKIFRDIDHRRFVSFGLVHGLIRRVHNFPYFLDAPDVFLDDDGWQRKQQQQSTSSLLMDRFSASRHDRIRSSGGAGLRNKDTTREDLRTLPSRVASLMDGKNCDDDLVCEFNRSFEELLDLVGRANVASVYATLDSPY